MNKIKQFNFLNKNSVAYPLRWFVIVSIVLTTIMGYANMVGWRLLSFDNQEKWSATGPGSHK
jgi:hypothetical protein